MESELLIGEGSKADQTFIHHVMSCSAVVVRCGSCAKAICQGTPVALKPPEIRENIFLLVVRTMEHRGCVEAFPISKKSQADTPAQHPERSRGNCRIFDERCILLVALWNELSVLFACFAVEFLFEMLQLN